MLITSTMERIKLNDTVKVPFILDMNKYLSHGSRRRLLSMEKEELFNKDNITSNHNSNNCNSNTLHNGDNNVYDDEDIRNDTNCGESNYLLKEYGEHLYDLYAVLVHSGSSLSGHYYAYIKVIASC